MTDARAFAPSLVAAPRREAAVRMALAEDLGRAGDITSDATIPPSAQARCVLRARDGGVIAGLPLAEAAFRTLDGAVSWHSSVRDADRASPARSSARSRDAPGRSLPPSEWR